MARPGAVLRTEEVRSEILRLTLDRPDSLNALSEDLMRDLDSQIRASSGQYEVLIVEGAGENFSAGVDLDEVSAGKNLFSYFTRLAEALRSFEGIVIGKLRGYAVGGAFETTLSFDLRYATPDATFLMTESEIDAIIGGGSSLLLPLLVGEANAKEMIFRATELDAAAAERLGLVNEVVDPADIDDRVRSIAVDLVENKSHDALVKNKRALNHALDLDDALDFEDALGSMHREASDDQPSP